MSRGFGHALAAVALERARQGAIWGEQNHPDGTGGPIFAETRDIVRDACDAAAKDGSITWRHILAEEYWEALSEDDPEKLRAELVQVAAVAVNWIECIDRRKANAVGE